MSQMVEEWIACINGSDFHGAANRWWRAPTGLAVGFAGKFKGVVFDRIECLMDAGSCGRIYRIYSSKRAPFLDLGVMGDGEGACLVSPQSVYRKTMASGWSVWEHSGLTVTAEDRSIISESVQFRLKQAYERLRRFFEPACLSFRYYVPTPETFRMLFKAERKCYPSNGRIRQSWFDPFSGDIVSLDPSDVHELTHACANSLDGWPPAILREGLAESFVTPYDWNEWKRIRMFCSLSQIWKGEAGKITGWYTYAAILAGFLYGRLHRQKFFEFWNTLEDQADLGVAVRQISDTSEHLEEVFSALCRKISSSFCGPPHSGLLRHMCSSAGVLQP